MAKGYQKHKERLDAIAFLGKDLARRARRKCELCDSAEDLRPYDTAPDDEPALETLVLMCSRCREVAEGRRDDPRTLRFLEGAVWSEVTPAAAVARAMIERIDADWARNTLEMLS